MINNLKAAKRDTKTKGQLKYFEIKRIYTCNTLWRQNPNLKLSINEKFVKDVLRSENFLSTVIDSGY